jgi:lipid-A-disaccharide synthase-like uncharacterized protein
MFGSNYSSKCILMNLTTFIASTVNFFGLELAVHPWKIVGWTGNLIFGTRFLLQWIATERAGRSIIPRSFWVVSSIGSLCLLSYFTFYQKDSVGILSVAFPLPIYLRNLYLQCRPRHSGPSAPAASEAKS